MAQRLRVLERAGLVGARWSREGGKNVRLYHLETSAFTVAIDSEGYQIRTPGSPVTRKLSTTEQVPPRPMVLGRGRELAFLSETQARFSMVVGLPGMGKTALAVELAHRYGAEHVFWHTFTVFDSPLRLLSVARCWLEALEPPKREPAKRENWDAAELLDEVVHGLARRPILIVLDDYQNVRDDGIHEIVRHWQRRVEKTRVLVLSRDRPPFDRTSGTQLLMLGGLDRSASMRLLKQSGLNTSPDEASRIDRAFGGHPLSLQLYAQLPEALRRAKGALLEDVTQGALGALDERSRGVLLALGAVRRPLDRASIRYLTDAGDPGLSLATLERRAMIRSSGTQYQIHDVLRDSLASFVAESPEIHRRAAALFFMSDQADDALEALYHATKAADWSAVGHLLERKLEGEGASPPGGTNLIVLREILAGIPVGKLEPRHQAMFYRAHAVAHLGVAKTTASLRELETARQIAEPLGDASLLGGILAALGKVATHLGRIDAAEGALLENVQLMEEGGRLDDLAHSLFALSGFYERKGDHRLERKYGKLAERAARRAGNERLVFQFRSYPYAYPSDWRKILPALRRWRGVFARWGVWDEVPGMDIAIGEIIARAAQYRARPRTDELGEAIRRLRRAVITLEAMGYKWEAGYSRSWLAIALCLANRPDEAEESARAVIELDRRTGPSHCSVVVHQVMNRLCRARGDIEGARKHADLAVRFAQRMRCSCVGITSLEQLLLEESLSGTPASKERLAPAVVETIRKGYPDEVRYARRIAREHGIVVDRGFLELASPSVEMTSRSSPRLTTMPVSR